jgi:predicted dehydrogenase/threonine dehydrogenase-like Zn-dependent dehydrogenase
MKQAIRRGLREIILDTVPDPVVASHHVLVRPVFSLISSGTETASIHQRSALREVAENTQHLKTIWEVLKVQGPFRTFSEVLAKFKEYAVLGYSGAGVVVDKDRAISEIEIGDRVAYGGEGTGHGECIQAGRNLVAHIPEGVPFEQACFATLGSIGLNAVRVASFGIGDKVAIIGLGLVGQVISQLVRQQGGTVIGMDLRADRLDLARQLGADHVVPAGTTALDAMKVITDGVGADCVIVAASSKSPDVARQALEICRERGRIVIVGAVDLSFPWNDMYLKEIQLLMARAYGPGCYDPAYEKGGRDYPLSQVRWTAQRNMSEFLELVAASKVQVAPLITHQFPLEEAAKAYETILNPDAGSLAVVLRYPAAVEHDPVRDYRPERKVQIHRVAPSTGRIGVALVGAGNLARWVHLPNLKKIPDVRLRAICSSSGARGKNYAVRFGADYCCSEYSEVLKDAEVGVVLIASRNQEHAAQAIDALRAGKHVFLEKPMALTEGECLALYRATLQSGKQLTIGFNRRYAPFYRAVKDQLKKRTGPVVLNCRVNSPGISGSYWMADPAIGGAILGEACHFADLLYWLLDSEPVRVSAYSLPTGKQEPIGENNLAASLEFADGSIANLTYCTLGSRTSGGERLEAFAAGTGLISEDFKRFSSRMRVRMNRSYWVANKGHATQLKSFFHAIRTGEQAEVTARDGARATLVCLRMLESARTRSPSEIHLEALLEDPAR